MKISNRDLEQVLQEFKTLDNRINILMSRPKNNRTDDALAYYSSLLDIKIELEKELKEDTDLYKFYKSLYLTRHRFNKTYSYMPIVPSRGRVDTDTEEMILRVLAIDLKEFRKLRNKLYKLLKDVVIDYTGVVD